MSAGNSCSKVTIIKDFGEHLSIEYSITEDLEYSTLK
jgi:hypothetical protein